MKKIIRIIVWVSVLLLFPIQTEATNVAEEPEITSEEKEPEETFVPVIDIEVEDYEDVVNVEEVISLSGTVVPSDATHTTIKYSSSNKKIATVSSSGDVKGISKGNVVITLSAGDFSKKIHLKVKVATKKIEINDDFLVLKPKDKFQLTATVLPSEAEQTLTYRSADSEVASVTASGLVKAKKAGITTVIISNGEISSAVSVIVNQSTVHKKTSESTKEENKTKVYDQHILVSECSLVDSEMLRYIYENQQILTIKGSGYTIQIDGKEIVNYNNELYTDIKLTQEEGKQTFILNNGENLCGPVILCLDNTKGKYLYLFNPAKEKYEKLKNNDLNEIVLTTSGEYMLCEKEINTKKKVVTYTVFVSCGFFFLGIVFFLIFKRRYWFW